MNDWIFQFCTLALGFAIGYWLRALKREEPPPTGLSFSGKALKNLNEKRR